MYKELPHSDTTMTQELLTTNFDHQRTAKLNNSKALSIIEEGSVNCLVKLWVHLERY